MVRLDRRMVAVDLDTRSHMENGSTTEAHGMKEFARIWFAYRKPHNWLYAARIAYGCAFRGLPF